VAGALFTSPANASVIWQANPNNGTKDFGSVNNVNGSVTIVSDSSQAYGKVWKILCHDNPSGDKAREELSGMHGFTPSNTGTYYFGWKHKWGPLPTKVGKWQVLEQIHLAGSGAQGGPVPQQLSVPGDGLMHINLQDPNTHNVTDAWHHSLPLGSWHSFVYLIKFSETVSGGYLEFWYDGSHQTLTNGKTRISCAMAHKNATSYWKWGVYRSGIGGDIGDSVAYLAHPRAGTTYNDVVP
jgi:hypothetical protein